MKKLLSFTILIFLAIAFSRALYAQEAGADEHASSSAQANNPLANMTALNFHNYYMSRLNEAPEGSYMNTGWIRFARPFADGKLLLRVSQPLNTIAFPSGGSMNSTSGLVT